jgi:hypothetical protein
MDAVKLARNSRGGFYECKQDWPEDCFVQCGDSGIVITAHKSMDVLADKRKVVLAIIGVLSDVESTPELPFYRTAFFEAFPRIPNTFIRGEGKIVGEAETVCWNIYQQYLSCDHPSFEARDYENGSGYCTKCGLWFPGVIPPFHPCQMCGKSTWYSQDKDGDFWCEEHNKNIPPEKLTNIQKMIREQE